jgi:hypothetical protein
MKSLSFRRKLGVFSHFHAGSGCWIAPAQSSAGSKAMGLANEACPLSSGFDRPPQNWLPGHRGVDLVGQSGDKF